MPLIIPTTNIISFLANTQGDLQEQAKQIWMNLVEK